MAAQASLFKPVAKADFELDIVGTIGEFGDSSLRQIRADLAKAGDPKTVSVVINGPGGSVFEGFAMYAELERHPASIAVEIRGIAASIHSVIAMAADPGQIRIHKLGRMMMHKARAGVFGTDEDAEAMRELLGNLDEGIATAYAKHFTWGATKIINAMAATTWLTSAEALKAGAVSEVVEGPDAVNRLDLSALDGLDVPADVRELYDSARPAPAVQVAGQILKFLQTHRSAPPTPAPSAELLGVVAKHLKQLRSTA